MQRHRFQSWTRMNQSRANKLDEDTNREDKDAIIGNLSGFCVVIDPSKDGTNDNKQMNEKRIIRERKSK